MSSPILKLYPSSSGFARGFHVFTKYPTACLRKILLNKHGVRETLKEGVQDLGLANEDAYEAALKADNIPYSREERVVRDLPDSGGVIFSGRVDFILRDDSGVRVVELKSSQSVNKRRELRAGRVSPENVAQLIAYMVELESISGELLYTFYDLKKKTKENYPFAVKIEPDGDIRINEALYEFSVHDYLRHRELAVSTLRTDTIGPRPFGADRAFDSPCFFCPFKERCEKVDKGTITDVKEFCVPL